MPEESEKNIEIISFPARNGDSFLIKYPDCNILIDAGYDGTFNDFIESTLKELNTTGQKLSRFIVTHIDEDHIHGAIPLLEANGSNEDHKLIAIEQIWFNSYRHLHKGETEYELTQIGEHLIKRLKRANVSTDSQISARQGSSFASLILKGKYLWNSDFAEGPVTNQSAPITLSDGIVVNLLSPTTENRF
jgi:metal-dependent hydrolase (beta-lactamase superfamily II)